jgi:hypothetical protein
MLPHPGSPTPAAEAIAPCLRSQRFTAGQLRSQLACRTTLRSQSHRCCMREDR